MSPIRDKEGRVVGALKIARDITGRKRADEALRERVKELTCIYSIADLIGKEPNLEKVLQGIADLVPDGWFYPDIACARIILLIFTKLHDIANYWHCHSRASRNPG